MKLLLHIDDSISAQEVVDAGFKIFEDLPWCTKVEIIHSGCGECARQNKGCHRAQTSNNDYAAALAVWEQWQNEQLNSDCSNFSFDKWVRLKARTPSA